MDVNLNGIDLGGSVPAGSARKTASSDGTAGSQDAPHQHQGEVNITSTASLLAHLQQSLRGKPAIDQARVDAISKTLAEGKYRVSPDSVARGLVQSERALDALNRPEL